MTPDYPYPALTDDAYRDTECLQRHLRAALTEWSELMDAADRRAQELAPGLCSQAARFAVGILTDECRTCGFRWLAALLAQMSPLDTSCRGLAAWCHLQQDLLRVEERNDPSFQLSVPGEPIPRGTETANLDLEGMTNLGGDPEWAGAAGEAIAKLTKDAATGPGADEAREPEPDILDPDEILSLALPLILGQPPPDEWVRRVATVRFAGMADGQEDRSRLAPVICTSVWTELREWGHRLRAPTPHEPPWSGSVDVLRMRDQGPPGVENKNPRRRSAQAMNDLVGTQPYTIRGPLPLFAEARRRLDKARNWLIARQSVEKQPDRLVFDGDTYTVTLDGQPFPGIDPTPFRLLRALYNARHSGPLSGEQLQWAAAMRGKNLFREWEKLPQELRDLVQGSGGKGYALRLPPQPGARENGP
jgi:hypothetical protein